MNEFYVYRPSTALVNSFLYPPTFHTRATAHGLHFEAEAIQNYEQISGHTVSRCGIFIDSDLAFLAASPDGIVEGKIVVEVKCPFSAKGKEINDRTVPYLKKCDGGFTLKKNHIYYAQVMCQLSVTGLHTCHFIVYTICSIIIVEIERDEEFILTLRNKAQEFFNEQLAPAIKNKYIYKNYYNSIF